LNALLGPSQYPAQSTPELIDPLYRLIVQYNLGIDPLDPLNGLIGIDMGKTLFSEVFHQILRIFFANQHNGFFPALLKKLLIGNAVYIVQNIASLARIRVGETGNRNFQTPQLEIGSDPIHPPAIDAKLLILQIHHKTTSVSVLQNSRAAPQRLLFTRSNSSLSNLCLVITYGHPNCSSCLKTGSGLKSDTRIKVFPLIFCNSSGEMHGIPSTVLPHSLELLSEKQPTVKPSSDRVNRIRLP